MDLHNRIYSEVVDYIQRIQTDLPQLKSDLELVANVAEGRLQWASPAEREFIEKSIIRVLETLLFDPKRTGRASNLELPLGFWEESELGQALMRALIWVKKEKLLTQAEAAKRFGKALQTINQAIRDGRLTKYIDFQANNPQQGRILVHIEELEQLYKEA